MGRCSRARAETVEAALPAAYRDAYFQLVLHPILASANLHRLYVAVARNRLVRGAGPGGGECAGRRGASGCSRATPRSGARYEEEIAGGDGRT